MTSMKQCNKCKELKSTSEFSKKSDAKDGLQPKCRSCQSAYNRERAERLKLKNSGLAEFPELKRCPTCGETKAGSEFGCHSSRADGLNGQCKSCLVEYRASNKLKNAERTEFPETKRCYSCGETKAGSEFYQDSNAADGLHSQCRSCNAEYNAVNKLNKAVKSGYRRAVDLGNHAEEFNGDDLEAHWLANGISKDHCRYCQVHFGALAPVEQQIDHVEALNTGGPHTVENIVPCCKSCNSSKHDRELVDWSIG
jgi:5-methylcytosine-specific restriction endonuclease McrA